MSCSDEFGLIVVMMLSIEFPTEVFTDPLLPLEGAKVDRKMIFPFPSWGTE